MVLLNPSENGVEEASMKRILLVLLIILTLCVTLGLAKSSTTSEAIRALLEEEIGETSNLGVEKITVTVVGEEIPDELFDDVLSSFALIGGRELEVKTDVCIVYFIGEDNFSRNWIKIGILGDIANIDYHLFEAFSVLNHLFVIAQFPIMNEYGNNELEIVCIQYLNRSTAAKINWEVATSALPKIIEEVADFFSWFNDF
jgi:hypothetical protein